jgi:hypothetical protein
MVRHLTSATLRSTIEISNMKIELYGHIIIYLLNKVSSRSTQPLPNLTMHDSAADFGTGGMVKEI